MSQEIESTPTTFELRCNSTGQIDNVAEVECNPIKCGFKFPDYMQSHVHYTNFTEYYFGYGNKKTFQCEEGYSTYREDFYTAQYGKTKKSGQKLKKKFLGFLRSKPSKPKMTFFSVFDLKNPRIFFF